MAASYGYDTPHRSDASVMSFPNPYHGHHPPPLQPMPEYSDAPAPDHPMPYRRALPALPPDDDGVSVEDPPLDMYGNAKRSSADYDDTFYPVQSTSIHEGANEKSAAVYPSAAPMEKRRGIWFREDRRAFQDQSLIFKILRIVAFILIIGIIVALTVIILIFMFLRPPNVGLNQPQLPNSTSAIQIQQNTFSFDVNLSAVIANPNYVTAHIKDFNATALDTYAKATSLGNCTLDDVALVARRNTTVNLPCVVSYNANNDPNLTILKDIVDRCGLVNSKSRQPLKVLIEAHFAVQLLAFHVPISVSPTVSFDCPLSKKQIEDLVGDHLDVLKELGLGSRSLPPPRSALSGLPVELRALQADDVKRVGLSVVDSVRAQTYASLTHASLNVRPPDTEWMNMGYWENTTEFPTACRALAQLLHGAADIPRAAHVLDVGHGSGDSLLLLAQAQPKCLHGVTSVPGHARRAQERLGDRGTVWCADAAAWLRHEASAAQSERARVSTKGAPAEAACRQYDTIFALDCAYHFADREAFFRNAYDRLAPGGALALVDLVSPWPYPEEDALPCAFTASALPRPQRGPSITQRLAHWLTCMLTGTPTQSFVPMAQYVQQLGCAGFPVHRAEMRDISAL
ncbi:hypothetical protein MSPP1_002133 [Malassezia sp. CBS 17886]|nr:hypothetical protein MSPP1_002133 [Malassezia sp. CBS 17886]